MKPRISVLTLAVKDLEKSVAFYRDGLGWKTDGIVGHEFENGAVAFFNLSNGLMLALWPQTSMEQDAGLPAGGPSIPPSFSLGHNVNSKGEVDSVLAKAMAAGAKVISPAKDKSWGGYTAYFADPDGHLWEVVWNPDLQVED
jgi:catechol 2,3-dioxygenase-like lactoylglutathione lyase family enzyme